MDVFTSDRLPTTFKWRQYHIEVLFGRRQHPAASGIRSAVSSPILEYASISAGGRVVETLTSETYLSPSLHKIFAIFLGVSRENPKNSPEVALTDGMERGECWALRGEFGQIGIQFTHAIRLSSLVVGHANTPSTASAPKKLVLWGLKSTDNGLCDTSGDEGISTPDFGPRYCGIHLFSGIHNPSLSSVYQNFTISTYNNHYFDRIVIQVLANWGHKAFTCIYRIQIYGNSK
jgi:Sad1 / UNC-like C-terminal